MTSDPSEAERASSDGQQRELTVRLTVPEMDCSSCAQKVDKSLQRVDGVVDTTLQPTTGTATVTYDSGRIAERDVVQAIENAGYEVVGGSDDAEDGADGGMEIAPPSEVWTSPRAIKTWIGAVLVVGGLLFEFVLTGQNATIASVLDYPLHVADVLFLGAVVASGIPVIRGGYYSAKNLSLDIDLLMGTAIIAATGIGYFVEAATLAVLFSVAEMLEDYAMDRARDSLRELIELSPDEATVKRDGEDVTVSADEVEVGETVVVRPGNQIPLDGTVVEGESAVDQSPITGESVPVDKTAGDEVYVGAINEEGYLEWRSRRRRVTPPSRASSRWYRAHRRKRPRASSSSTGSRGTTRRSWSWWRSDRRHPAAAHRRSRVGGRRRVRDQLRRRLADVVHPRAHPSGDRLPLRVRHLDARLGGVGHHQRREERRPHQGRQLPRGDGRGRRRRHRVVDRASSTSR